MSSTTRRGTQRSLQSLLLKRFAMAFATYPMMALVCWFAVFNGLFLGSISTAAWLTLGVFGSQLVFLWLFLSGRNLRCDDPSLTEAQVLVALAWQPPLLALFDSARGVMMVFYVLILLFGVFQLPPRVFVRCAAFAFFGFTAMVLIEAYRMQLVDPSLAWLQVWVLFILLVWLCLFSSYVQAMRKRMHQRRFALQAHQDTLRGMMRQLEDLVATDELTGLFNRRSFDQRLTEEMDLTMRYGSPMALVMYDFDGFKGINDAHGHVQGDKVLEQSARLVRDNVRSTDMVVRWGGEEFMILVPQAKLVTAKVLAEKLRQVLEEYVFSAKFHVTASFGVTEYVPGESKDTLLKRVDDALYRAKALGRNRVEVLSS